jgi:ribosomal protein S18 acetylase RimI-like enzyme
MLLLLFGVVTARITPDLPLLEFYRNNPTLLSGRLIAVGRAVADGRDCSYISGVAVHPDHQGLGIGKEVVSKLVNLSKGHRKIILYAAPGKEPFYRKLGFRRMATAMAIFQNQAKAQEDGLLIDES